MTRDRQGKFIAVAFIVYAVLIGGLSWHLHSMNDDYVMGFGSGVAATAGAFFLASGRLRRM